MTLPLAGRASSSTFDDLEEDAGLGIFCAGSARYAVMAFSVHPVQQDYGRLVRRPSGASTWALWGLASDRDPRSALIVALGTGGLRARPSRPRPGFVALGVPPFWLVIATAVQLLETRLADGADGRLEAALFLRPL